MEGGREGGRNGGREGGREGGGAKEAAAISSGGSKSIGKN